MRGPAQAIVVSGDGLFCSCSFHRSICAHRHPNLTVTKEIGDRPAWFPTACRAPRVDSEGEDLRRGCASKPILVCQKMMPMLQIVHREKGPGT